MTDEAAILRALSAAMRSSPPGLPPGAPDLAGAAVRLANGVPALTGEPVLDWAGLARNASSLALALVDTAAGDTARRVLVALMSVDGTQGEESLVAIALAGAWDGVPDFAVRLQVDADALLTVLDYAARPALRAAAAAIRPILAESSWGRGRCPACGAPPSLSVISGKERDRTLHCARCATAWAFARVRCPACGEENHERLGYLHAAGEGEYRRIEVCDSCHGYVKSVALLDAPEADRLLQLDLETAALDFLALDRGYARV
jgi:FdhE protein